MSCTSTSRLQSADTQHNHRRRSTSSHHESPRSQSAHHSRAPSTQSPEKSMVVTGPTRPAVPANQQSGVHLQNAQALVAEAEAKLQGQVQKLVCWSKSAHHSRAPSTQSPEKSVVVKGPARPPVPANQQAEVHRQNAQSLVAEAEAKLQGKSKYRCGGGGKGPQSALDCYERAVAQYKMAGEWGEAGNVLETMGNMMQNTGDNVGGARIYGEAAICYKKFSSSSAISCFLKSAETYQELGKFGNAAKHHETVALIYSKDMKPPDNESVLHHLSLAADLYRDDGRRAPRSRCQLEMARLYGLNGQYENAIAMYEDMGYSALENRLLKYCADEYLFRAALCHLCVDCLNCQIAIKKYIDYYPAFALSREYKFIKSLCEEVEQENEEGFDCCMANYKSLCNLDPWYITILGKIKGHLPTELDSLR